MDHMRLFDTIDQGDFECAHDLLVNGANVDIQDDSERTLLHCACHDAQWLQFFLNHGAVVDTPDSNGATPLNLAAFYGDRECLEVLLDAGADVVAERHGGETALHQAAWVKDLKRAKDNIVCLVEHGADPLARDNHGKTPAQTAQEQGNLELANFINALWPPLDVDRLFKEVRVRAEDAIKNGDEETFRKLTDAGLDVTFLDPYEAKKNLSEMVWAWLAAPVWDRLEEWNANADPIWNDVAFRVFSDPLTPLDVAQKITDFVERDLIVGLYDSFTEQNFFRKEHESAGVADLFEAKLELLKEGVRR